MTNRQGSRAGNENDDLRHQCRKINPYNSSRLSVWGAESGRGLRALQKLSPFIGSQPSAAASWSARSPLPLFLRPCLGIKVQTASGRENCKGTASLPRLLRYELAALFGPGIFGWTCLADESSLPRSEWGAPAVAVSHSGDIWTIAGEKHSASLNEKNLALTIQTRSNKWAMVPSGPTDMLVKVGAEEFPLRLADAQQILVTSYDTGFKTGVKLKLGQWRYKGKPLDLTLYLTVTFDGRDEELVFEAAADEHAVAVRQLDWPTAMDAHEVECTILPNGRGNLLPRDWPKE